MIAGGTVAANFKTLLLQLLAFQLQQHGCSLAFPSGG